MIQGNNTISYYNCIGADASNPFIQDLTDMINMPLWLDELLQDDMPWCIEEDDDSYGSILPLLQKEETRDEQSRDEETRDDNESRIQPAGRKTPKKQPKSTKVPKKPVRRVPPSIQLTGRQLEHFDDDVSTLFHPRHFFKYSLDGDAASSDCAVCSTPGDQRDTPAPPTTPTACCADNGRNSETGSLFAESGKSWIPSEIDVNEKLLHHHTTSFADFYKAQYEEAKKRTRKERSIHPEYHECSMHRRMISPRVLEIADAQDTSEWPPCGDGSRLTEENPMPNDVDAILDDLVLEELRTEMGNYDEYGAQRKPRGMLRAMADPSCVVHTLSAPLIMFRKALSKNKTKIQRRKGSEGKQKKSRRFPRWKSTKQHSL